MQIHINILPLLCHLHLPTSLPLSPTMASPSQFTVAFNSLSPSSHYSTCHVYRISFFSTLLRNATPEKRCNIEAGNGTVPPTTRRDQTYNTQRVIRMNAPPTPGPGERKRERNHEEGGWLPIAIADELYYSANYLRRMVANVRRRLHSSEH